MEGDRSQSLPNSPRKKKSSKLVVSKKFSFKLDKNLSPRSKAQQAINEINYGVSELIDMRMDIANTMEKITDEEDDDEDDRIIE